MHRPLILASTCLAGAFALLSIPEGRATTPEVAQAKDALNPEVVQTQPLFTDAEVTRAAPVPLLLTPLRDEEREADDPLAQIRPQARPDTGPALELDGLTDTVATLAPPAVIGDPLLRAKLVKAPTRAVHTVRAGETIDAIALRYYGDRAKAAMILEANRRHLGTGRALLIGQILRIPDIDGF